MFFLFLCRSVYNKPVCHSCGTDGDIGWQGAQASLMHLPSCVHLDQSHIGRTGQADRTADQCDARAMCCTGSSKCMALLSGRSVGDIADWINWLICWARCNQHMSTDKTASVSVKKLDRRIGNISQFFKVHRACAAKLTYITTSGPLSEGNGQQV